MSYILEALRRADEERDRERGAVPSIHSQPSASAPDEARTPRQPRLLLGVIAALLLVLVALLAWHLMRDESPRQVAVAPAEPAPAVQVAPPPQPTEPAPAAQAVQAPPPVQAVQQPAPHVPPPPAAAIAPISPVSPVVPPVPVRPPIQPRTPPSSPVPPPLPNAGVPPAAVPAAEARLYSASELPEDVRRDLPKLVIGGAMYSDNPGNRMLIINSQIFHEGDKLAPDLQLQEIKLKSAVLKYKGYRYAVNY